jgi:hypothetical protein
MCSLHFIWGLYTLKIEAASFAKTSTFMNHTSSYPMPAREGLVVDRLALGEAFLLVLRSSPVSTIAPMRYTHSSFIDTIHATGLENLCYLS